MNVLQKWKAFHPARRWDPFKEIEDMQEHMARLFEPSPIGPENGREPMSALDWVPLVDITEDDKEYLIKTELPEVKKEDVKVFFEGGVLKISGERKHEADNGSRKPHRIERSYGRFVRSFTLPGDAIVAKVSAEFKDGMLKVHVPKDDSARPKTLDIKVG